MKRVSTGRYGPWKFGRVVKNTTMCDAGNGMRNALTYFTSFWGKFLFTTLPFLSFISSPSGRCGPILRTLQKCQRPARYATSCRKCFPIISNQYTILILNNGQLPRLRRFLIRTRFKVIFIWNHLKHQKLDSSYSYVN